MKLNNKILVPLEKKRWYGYRSYAKRLLDGTDDSRLRTKQFSLPKSLRPGDTLANDIKVIDVMMGTGLYRDRIGLYLGEKSGNYRWYHFVSCDVPLALSVPGIKNKFKLPGELMRGDRLANGWWVGDVLTSLRSVTFALHIGGPLEYYKWADNLRPDLPIALLRHQSDAPDILWEL